MAYVNNHEIGVNQMMLNLLNMNDADEEIIIPSDIITCRDKVLPMPIPCIEKRVDD